MTKNLILIAAVFLALFILSVQPGFALYRWTDETGGVHISETPNPTDPLNGEYIPDKTSKPNNNRPSSITMPQMPIIMQPSYGSGPEAQQSGNGVSIPPARNNMSRFDEEASQRQFEQAMEPLARLITKMILIGLIHLCLFVLGLASILKSEFTNNLNKLIWVLVVLVMPGLGIILYFFIGRTQRIGHEETGETSFRYSRYRDIGRD